MTSRHRGAKRRRRYERSGDISLFAIIPLFPKVLTISSSKIGCTAYNRFYVRKSVSLQPYQEARLRSVDTGSSGNFVQHALTNVRAHYFNKFCSFSNSKAQAPTVLFSLQFGKQIEINLQCLKQQIKILFRHI